MRTLALTLLLAAIPLQAQDAATAPKASPSVDSNLVILPVIVRDHKGDLVPNLTLADFSLQIAAKPQTLRYFDHDHDTPLTLGLILDVSRTSQRDRKESSDRLAEEQAAGTAFLNAMLAAPAGQTDTKHPSDQAFVVQFAKQIELLQDLTPDRAKLVGSLKLLGTDSPSFHTASEADTTDAEGRHVRNAGTSLYDALFLSTDEITSKQTGRKVLVVLTDGIDVGSKTNLADTLESVQRSDTIVYAVYLKGTQRYEQPPANSGPRTSRSGGYGYPGSGYPGGGGYPGGSNPNNPSGGNTNPNTPGGGSRKPLVDGKQLLERLCGETGGRVFELGKKLTLEDIYTQIGEELRSQYRLGFTPEGPTARYGLHQIDLSLTNPELNKKLNIQTRSGYYANGDSR